MRRPPWLAVVSLARWSALRALGARKSWRAKFLPDHADADRVPPGVRRARASARSSASSFANRFPELIPYRQYLHRDRARRHDLRGRSCAPSCSAPTGATACSRSTSRRPSAAPTYVARQAARGAPAAAAGLTLAPVLLLFVGNTFFADSARSATSRTTGTTSPHRRRRDPARWPLLHAWSGSRSRRSRAAGPSRSAATLALMLVPTFVGGVARLRRRAGATSADHARPRVADRRGAPLYPVVARSGRTSPAGAWWAVMRSCVTAISSAAVVALPEGRGVSDAARVRRRLASGTATRSRSPTSRSRSARRHRPARAQRRRQVDGAQAVRRASRRRARARCGCSGTIRGASPRCSARIGVVPDQTGSWPFLTAREVVELCARLRDVADPGGRRPSALETVELDDVAERRSAASRRACASASSSRRRSSTTPSCCCWTSRSTASTRPSAADHRADAPARRRGPHGARLVARAARGRADGAARASCS